MICPQPSLNLAHMGCMDEYMITALEEARTGAREGGVPIGAVLVNARGTVVAIAGCRKGPASCTRRSTAC